MQKISPFLLITAIVAIAYSCAVNPVTGKKQVMFVSEAQEAAMGKEYDPQIVAQFGLYQDAKLQAFITEKGKEMAAISHRPQLPYEFKVVDSDVINAFAVPGGYVYFTRGIMAHFNNEAEFAGVLGHEIGHITARHSAQQQTRSMLGQGGLLAGMILAPDLAGLMEPAAQGLQLLFLSYGRDAERESDKLGVEYSSKIGYDAREMAGFFNTLERQSARAGGGRLPDFMSTHPDPGERNKTVASLAAKVQQQMKLQNPKINRDQYLARIDGIMVGPDPKQGFVEGNAFYHPELKFQLPIPQGWRSQNEPTKLTLGSQDGKAMVLLTLAQGNNPREAAQTFATNNKINVTESRDVTVNGLPAFAFSGNLQQQGQQALSLLIYFIQLDGRIYNIAAVAGSNDFNNYSQTMNAVQQGFRQLTDASKINKKAERVSIRTTGQPGNLQQALTRLNMPANRFEEIAILNGMQLTENVPVGTKIKIIQ